MTELLCFSGFVLELFLLLLFYCDDSQPTVVVASSASQLPTVVLATPIARSCVADSQRNGRSLTEFSHSLLVLTQHIVCQLV
jgi:hypothetical protein